MEQINFGVSTKNIPIPDLAEYRVQMIHSVNKFVRNIRWKSHFALNPQDRGETHSDVLRRRPGGRTEARH